VFEEVVHHLNSSGTLVNEQFGFRKDLSNIPTYKCTHEILQVLDKKSGVLEFSVILLKFLVVLIIAY